jgi:molecular chaperone DnaK
MVKIVGIDLGTSTSAVAVMDQGRARILYQDERDRILPTVVSITERGEIVVGSTAKNLLESAPLYTYTGLKRLLGRRFDDPHVKEWSELVAYEMVPGPAGEAYVRGPDRAYSPVELLAHVFMRLKDTAQSALSAEVSRAVVGAPAHFDQVQRKALCDAARLGGIEPVRLLAEPTAAAVAYGVDQATNRVIAVYDFGGGTFDVTILQITGRRFRVAAAAGDPFLGGEDFDQRVVEWLVECFKAKHGIDLRDDPSAKNRLRLAAERAKHELSSVGSWAIREVYIAKALQGGHLLDLEETLDRETLEELVGDLVERTREPCRQAMARAKVGVHDIKELIRVGGMTRMPMVARVAEEMFARKLTQKFDPMMVVALGCAMQGAALAGEMRSVDLKEVVVRSIGVEVGNGAIVPIIRAGKSIPAREHVDFTMADPGKPAAAIRIYEGDLKSAADNRLLGTMVMNDQARHDMPLIRVTMDLNESGMLTTTVLDRNTNERIEHSFHADTGMNAAEQEALRDLGSE